MKHLSIIMQAKIQADADELKAYETYVVSFQHTRAYLWHRYSGQIQEYAIQLQLYSLKAIS